MMTEHVEKQEVEATETMMDAMNSVQEVNIGDIVKGETER